ncbi:MAG: hypothetical protein IJM22_01555 [Treponema sp.]|uniref:hypothetical protein n=1 Tax=Treponema sp. TaxID=166 RepID=UPI00298E8675|nr:hypothetical protein [uncultured Treponema sp.]MBR0154740.1 hypothetical protein [Treponema sp.]
MASTNAAVIVFHPNTQQAIIELREKLLQKNFTDYYPLYPLFGFFTDKDFSPDLKSDFKKLNKCSVKSFFIKDDIFYLAGDYETDFKKSFYIIPLAINKKADDKNLSSAFCNSIKIIKKDFKIPKTKIEKEITFKSFKIADCRFSKNQYSVYDSFWIKISS